MNSVLDVDRSIPAPSDDGAAGHLTGARSASVMPPATDGTLVDLPALRRRTVVYAYPRTAQPGIAMPEEWDMIPGARGCTPQSCAFRDHLAELRDLGVDYLFGLSTKDTVYQQEAATGLHLPFPLLSDRSLAFARAMDLPTFEADRTVYMKRLTLIVQDGWVERVFYPVFPPDRNADDVIQWLRQRRVG